MRIVQIEHLTGSHAAGNNAASVSQTQSTHFTDILNNVPYPIAANVNQDHEGDASSSHTEKFFVLSQLEVGQHLPRTGCIVRGEQSFLELRCHICTTNTNADGTNYLQGLLGMKSHLARKHDLVDVSEETISLCTYRTPESEEVLKINTSKEPWPVPRLHMVRRSRPRRTPEDLQNPNYPVTARKKLKLHASRPDSPGRDTSRAQGRSTRSTPSSHIKTMADHQSDISSLTSLESAPLMRNVPIQLDQIEIWGCLPNAPHIVRTASGFVELRCFICGGNT